MALARQAQAGESWGVQLPTQAFVDGRYVDAQGGGTLPCVFPGNGRTIGHVAACETADVDAAVGSARKAFESGAWSRMAPQDRRKVLLKLSELILHNRDELATLETLNVGKPLVNAKTGDIPSAAACIGWFGEAIDKIYGEVGPTPHDLTAVITREPLGVVAAVVPWNYPLSMAAWKLGPALAAGNSVVLKPAEQSPYTALRIAGLAMEAGLPPGVLNVISGYGETAGQALGRHMDVDCVTFTGSTEVGKLFMRYAGESNAKRVSLELGGKSPQVVLADSDLDAAAAAVAAGIFSNAGQVCNAGSRLIVDRAIKDKLLDRIVTHARNLRVGDPFDADTKMGACRQQGAACARAVLHRERQAGRRDRRHRRPQGRRTARRILRRADRVRRRQQRHEDRAGGDLRAGPVDDRVPGPGRGAGHRQRYRLRPRRRGMDERHSKGAARG